jgi:hypothetical protein
MSFVVVAVIAMQHFRSQYVEGYLEKRKHTPVDNTDKPASGPSSPSPSPSPLASAPSDDASNWTRKWAVLDHAKLYYYDHALSRSTPRFRKVIVLLIIMLTWQ